MSLTRAPVKVAARLTRHAVRAPIVLDGTPVVVRALARFPADLRAGAGLKLTQSGLTYTYSFGFETLIDITPTDLAGHYIPIWDGDTYARTNLQAIADAVSIGVGTGNVVGPASAVDDRIATFDGTTGKLIQDGGMTIAEILAAAGLSAEEVDDRVAALFAAGTHSGIAFAYDDAANSFSATVTGGGAGAVATQPEAQEAVDNTKTMTPLRVLNSIDYQRHGHVHINNFIPYAEHAAIFARTSTYMCDAALSAAIAALPVQGGVVEFGSGDYNFALPINLQKRLHLKGVGRYTNNNNQCPTKLIFQPDSHGIVINRSDTFNDGVIPSVGNDASGSRLEDLQLFQKSGGTSGHGVYMRERAACISVWVQGFGGNGFYLVGDDKDAEPGNFDYGTINCFYLEACRAESCDGHGFRVTGQDANAGIGIMCNAAFCGGCGIWDSAFLANAWIQPHAAGCGFNGKVMWKGYVWWMISSSWDNVAGTPEPGTPAAVGVWHRAEADDTPTIPDWSPSDVYRVTNVYRLTGGGKTLISPYIEDGQAPVNYEAGTILGGMGTGNLTTSGAQGLWITPSSVIGSPKFDSLLDVSENIFIQYHIDGSEVVRFKSTYDGAINGSMNLMRDRDDGFWEWRYNRSTSTRSFGHTTVPTTLFAGKPVTPVRAGSVFFGRGLLLGDDGGDLDNLRRHASAGAIPTTGEFARGTVLWNYDYQTGEPAFWICSQAGYLPEDPWVAGIANLAATDGNNLPIEWRNAGNSYRLAWGRSDVIPVDGIATTVGDPTVTVTKTAHGRSTGDLIKFTKDETVGGTTLQYNELWPITRIDADRYSYQYPSNATSTDKNNIAAGTSSPVLLPVGAIRSTAGSGTYTVTLPGHGLATNQKVRFFAPYVGNLILSNESGYPIDETPDDDTWKFIADIYATVSRVSSHEIDVVFEKSHDGSSTSGEIRTTAGSNIVTVQDTSFHRGRIGDRIVLPDYAVGGLNLLGSWPIVSVTDRTLLTFQHSSNATSTDFIKQDLTARYVRTLPAGALSCTVNSRVVTVTDPDHALWVGYSARFYPQVGGVGIAGEEITTVVDADHFTFGESVPSLGGQNPTRVLMWVGMGTATANAPVHTSGAAKGATDGHVWTWLASTFLFDPIGAVGAGGTGDVVGPASAVADRIAAFNGTTGKLIKDGGQTVAGVLARANHTGTQTASTISDFNTAVDARIAAQPEALLVAASDEATALTIGTAKTTFRMPFALTLTAVRASLTTAQASGSIFTVDINEGGTSILSTKLTIDNTEKTSTTAATAAVISDAVLADDAEITIDIDQVGDGTAKGLKVTLIGTRT